MQKHEDTQAGVSYNLKHEDNFGELQTTLEGGGYYFSPYSPTDSFWGYTVLLGSSHKAEVVLLADPLEGPVNGAIYLDPRSPPQGKDLLEALIDDFFSKESA